ncbi:Ankyrin repeat-containing protein [Glarea lozoyensis ATCC 20868]|uniref:Ankyrin repeat-containing protein n=1 Tax=Glarea lozoyensis (strain ATCC 20868 / MF5171) TaxID=1116229 RepID=S3CLX3_GLAL2|nr:Ankyrin repeat-containing protein [Glarea lozoyensis ATCC 20868]EPE26194.1 Ankyrin repeat-containing protein [Glarea lozoyensis ATCC 20868]
MSTPPQPQTGYSRVSSPTPTAAEAQGDIYLSRTRFRHLSALNAQPEIPDLLQQWTSQSVQPPSKAAEPSQQQSKMATNTSSPNSQPAVRTGDLEILELLLTHGWDPTVTATGKSRLDQVLSNPSILRWFLAHGADPNAWCPYAVTSVTEAARSAPLDTLRILVDHGGIVVATDAVAQAVVGDVLRFPGRLEVVRYLLERGAPVDAYRFEGVGSEAVGLMGVWGMETGLQIAVRGGRGEMVRLLVGYGADGMKRGGFGTRGETAGEIAEGVGLREIGMLLKRP